MKRIWFSSDHHLGHSRVVAIDNRPFQNIDEHDAELLRLHNEVVGDDDDVYYLGDVSFSRPRLEHWMQHARGHKHLIRGNHDDKIAWTGKGWASKNEALYLRVNGYRVYLSHYSHRVWRNSHHGSFHLYGHSHGGLPPHGRSMDVGVMLTGYRPVSIEEVASTLSSIPVCDGDGWIEPSQAPPSGRFLWVGVSGSGIGIADARGLRNEHTGLELNQGDFALWKPFRTPKLPRDGGGIDVQV